MTLVIRFEPGLRPILKHQEHDQSSHGNWATGGEIETWNPKDTILDSPKNAGGMTAKSWEAWEHGPDGQNFIALFRKYASEELGLEVPKTPFDPGEYLNYMMDRGWGKPSRDEAKEMLNAIANGRPQPTLYRGMTDSSDPQEQKSFDALLSSKTGDTFDMPLVSTSRSIGVATWYAADVAGVGKRSVVMKIQDGAKGVALKKDNSTYPQDYEVITSGKFEVVSVSKVSTPYWSRGIFEPRKNEYTDGTPPNYQVATYSKKTYTPQEAKIAYEAVQSGNLSSLETPAFKLTDDRASKGSLSSWTREPAKEFTVIEVKMVEPHTVQKAKDFGNEFFFLFNNMPFIDDDIKDMQKHQQHDQSTHGNWATGGGDMAINKFENAVSQAYGTGEEAFTISYTGDNSVAALGEYLARGHTVNDNIRSSATMGEAGYLDLGDGKTYADSSVVKGLDNAIEMAPRMPNQKVWRTASAEAIENLRVNGVYIDKGFTSTTAVDITHPDNGMLLLTLSTVSSGRKALMEINTGSVGKGLYIPRMFPGQPIAEKEREFLLPRETKMRYLGSDLNISPSGKTIVEIHKFKVED